MLRRFMSLTLLCMVPGLVLANVDHPLISAYPGAKIRKHLQVDYEQVSMPTGTVSAGGLPTQVLVGDLSWHTYVIKGVSTLKLYENYRQALDKMGFEIRSSCALEACGSEAMAQQLGNAMSPEAAVYNWHRKPYYLLAEKAASKGTVTVGLFIGGYESEAAVQQMIIEGEPLDAGLLDVAPAYLQQQSAPTPARAANVNPEEDHPLLSRYPGATVRKRHKAEYETVKVPMSTADGRGAFATRELVGDLERHVYALKGVSTLKVHENYKAALDKAGFKTLFACALEACGSERQAQALGDAVSVENAVYNFYRKPYYVVAERVSPQGSTYVVLYVGGYEDDVFIQQTVLETTPLQSDLVQVNAESLHRDIEATGKALIYGIYFDTDKASIKPESTPTLEAIADLLNRHPQLNLYVVGHTDDSGARSHNEALSLARATAVVEQLTRTYRIGPDRLLAQGVGPYAPAASNRNDAGKAQNRRVELVQRL